MPQIISSWRWAVVLWKVQRIPTGIPLSTCVNFHSECVRVCVLLCVCVRLNQILTQSFDYPGLQEQPRNRSDRGPLRVY
jgi:hypothetical protein